METNDPTPTPKPKPISFAELAELKATVPVYHRERLVCHLTIRPEVITPAFRASLLSKVNTGDVDGNTEMILAAGVGWDFKMQPGEDSPTAPFTSEFLRGLSFGLRNSIATAINMEAVNPSSASD